MAPTTKNKKGSDAAKAAAPSSISSAKPTGIKLRMTPNWSIGQELGAGSQGAVYEIVVGSGDDNGKKKKDKSNNGSDVVVSTEWVVKVTPVPVPTKKKTSLAELNAGSLNKESLIYQSLMPTLRGSFIPKNPTNSIPAYLTNVQGFNCLILERMECSLHDGISQLLQQLNNDNNNNSFEIHLGSLAAKLMDLAQNIHDKRHLIIDVKPDNLMLASASAARSTSVAGANDTKNKKRRATATNNTTVVVINTDDVADRLRLIDLGLMTPCKERDVNGTGSLRGNALYASLNMHRLETSSRRDDVEMLLYVLAEVAILVKARWWCAQGNGNNNTQQFLPWSKGKSDDDVFKIKQAQVENRKSDFYRLLDAAAAAIILESLQAVWAMDFNTKPDYQAFKTKLAKLVVKVTAAAAPTTTKAAAVPSKKNAATQKNPPPAAAAAAAKRTRSRHSISSPTPINQVQSPVPSDATSPGPTPRKPAARLLTRTSSSSTATAAAKSSTGSAESSSNSNSTSNPIVAVISATTASSSSRAARASAREAKKDSRTIATQTSPHLMSAASAAGHATMEDEEEGDDDDEKHSERKKRSKPSSSTNARNRYRLSTESDQTEESFASASSSSPCKIRKGNNDPEVIDMMDIESSPDEDQEFHDCCDDDDDDVEMETVSDENEKPAAAASSAAKPIVSVKLVIMTPGFDPHEVSLAQGSVLILGSKPTKTGLWVEIPKVRAKHCTLELIVKKGKVMGITVTSVDGVTTVDNGRAVPHKKSLICLENKIILGQQTVITISKEMSTRT